VISVATLLNDLAWDEIPNCPGRYRLSRGRASSHPLDLAGADAEAIPGESDRCRDPFLIVPFPDGGGLLSYVAADGSYIHTLNTAAGLNRKLRDLGLSLRDGTIRPR
jgi:hypothetical protein